MTSKWLTRDRNTFWALLASGFSLMACFSVLRADAGAYIGLSQDRLRERVGAKGTCCTPGPKSECVDAYPFACCSGVICNPGTNAVDICDAASCGESDNRNDQCDPSENAKTPATVTTCAVNSVVAVSCSAGGSRCMYVTGTIVANFTGCGTNTFCAVTSGPSCQ